jgi:hypothetical protein
MVDPRIYRALLAVVLFAVIIFGFSFEDQPSGFRTEPAPEQFFTKTYGEMKSLAGRFPDRAPGSSGDTRLAGYVDRQFSQLKGFSVTTSDALAHTADGTREIENVVADRPGLSASTIVIVAHRDATGRVATADMSGTAVLLGLAHAFSGETLNRGIELISTSAQVGMAGATALAQRLSGEPVDAVIVLGNLAGKQARNPVVVPWSGSDTVAAPALRSTVDHYVHAQTGLRVTQTGLGGQLVRLAFPFSITEQAPFNDAGISSVLVSLSGDRTTPANAALGPPARVGEFGNAVLDAANALGAAAAVAPPSTYLVIAGKLVPDWAFRLLIFTLILPVLATAIDALARARRRGHSLLRWVGWVLAGAVPFLVALVALYLARLTGALSASPPGAVGAHAVSVTVADVAVMLAVAVLLGLSFWKVRPLCLKLVRQLVPISRAPESPPADAAAVALTLVMCVLALIVWIVNPYTALLFVPALHLWLWLAQPDLRSRRVGVLAVVVAALLPAIPILVYYGIAYGLTPWGMLWSLTLMVAGGAMPPVVALYGVFTLGCFAGALVIAWRSAKAGATPSLPAAKTRGPLSYAGPGSLGGTESALRR